MFPTTSNDLTNSSMTEKHDMEQRHEHGEDPSVQEEKIVQEIKDELLSQTLFKTEDEKSFNFGENDEDENSSENNTAIDESVNTSMDSNISTISIDNGESSAESPKSMIETTQEMAQEMVNKLETILSRASEERERRDEHLEALNILGQQGRKRHQELLDDLSTMKKRLRCVFESGEEDQ